MATPQSTLPDQQNDERNPGNSTLDLFDAEKRGAAVSAGIDQAEAFANDPNNATNAVRDAEEDPDSPLKDGLYRPTGGQKQRVNLRGIVNKRGPLFALISLVFGAGLGFSALFSPSLLIVHMKEIMVEKFNTGLASAEIRSSKLLNAKIEDTTRGLCGEVITMKCRFSTMSEKQVTNFRNAGITVLPETPTNGKRTKPTGYVFKGQTITAGDFARIARSDPDFKSALRRAYNPKFGIFLTEGRGWRGTATALGVSKAPTDLSGDDREESIRKINQAAKNGDSGETDSSRFLSDSDTDPCDQTCADQKLAEANQLKQDGASGEAAKRASSALSSPDINGLVNTAKLTGALDSYCQAYQSIKAIGYAAKTVRAIQLARYMMVFLKVADEIKAGTATAASVALLGSIITEVRRDAADTSKVVIGSGTDSLGYKNAAYGDTKLSTRSMNIANRFMAGGGLTGDLLTFSNTIMAMFPGGKSAAGETCTVLANPFVQFGSLAAGIAVLFVPGANVAKVGVSVVGGAAVSLGLAMLPTLLADIIAGTVTDNIVGEESVNAIASGSGKTFSDTLAGFNGNGAMTKADALAYLSENNRIAAEYADTERDSRSPLDPTSRHTFVGNMVSRLIPPVSSAQSGATSQLSVVGSILATSFGSLNPLNTPTSAYSNGELDVCQDEEALDAGYATDIFCNVIRGIPPKYLNKDPFTVIDELVAGGYLDAAYQLPTATYTAFVEKCITSTEPIGYDPATGIYTKSRAQECIINDSNANMYLYYLDTNDEANTSGEDPLEQTASTIGDSTSSDKRALAQKILTKNKITFFRGTFPARPTLEEIATGAVDANSLDCGVNVNILRLLDAITDKHSITISSLNRNCTDHVPRGSSLSSRHYAGNGSALDISVIDGRATTGRDANAMSVIAIILPIMSEIAVANNSFAQLGQARGECGPDPVILPGIRPIKDFCNHLHVDIPPASDPNLEYLINGARRGGGVQAI